MLNIRILFLLFALPFLSISPLPADPPVEVHEDTSDTMDGGGGTCNLPGWCGNGNDRYYQMVVVPGDLVPSACNRLTGIYCGTY